MIGSKLGPYEITARLGEGGMGEVYRATDTKLRREVAVKVLPAAFTENAERLARFEREAQLLAQLHHPNIASIFGLEESGGVRALVMELVEGPTLADRLAAGSLPAGESLAIAVSIAQALEEAHAKGIVHRDLKPQNIKASVDGKVKVLDFGLAKAMDPAAGPISGGDLARSPTLLQSPTLTALPGTQAGVILGTAAYMAPEQARGGAVDRRADIWAFGVVLYEMLAGRTLFVADTLSDTLAGVLKTEIDFSRLPAAVPAGVRQLLRRCLERNPRNRLHDIADARIVLEDVIAGRADDGAAAPATAAPAAALPASARLLPWAIAALALIGAVAVTVVHLRGPRPEAARAIRFHVTPPESTSPTRRGSGFELSPDGRHLVITAAGELWVRPLDAIAPRRLEGVEDATYPFWSPDSASIGFFAEGQLRRIPRDGGPVQRLCDAPDGRGATWGPDGVIVFSAWQGTRGLWRVSAQGGQPAPVTTMATADATQYHRYPRFLPDGRSLIYLHLAAAPEIAGVYVATLEGGAPERLLDGSNQAFYAPAASGDGGGWLLYRRDKTLMAQPFDPVRRRVTGDAGPIEEGVGSGPNTGSGAFSVSANGVLAFAGDWERSGELVWVDRSGKRLGTVNSETRELQGLSLAPGARRVAYGTGNPSDVWIQALPAGEPSRFTFGQAPGWAYPVWSPDGGDLVYTTWDLAGFPQYEVRRRRADRTGAEQTLLRTTTAVYPWDWSPDGRSLIYGNERGDLWLLPLAGEREPVPYIEAPGMQAFAQFSPDGRFVAYASDTQGQFDVFVGTVPPSGALWQISTAGGSMPRWRRDGRELYYRAPDGTMMVVALGAGGGAAAIDSHAAPQALFPGLPSSGNTPIFTYCPVDDGQRFLVASSRSAAQPPITLVVNWPVTLGEGRPADPAR